MTTLLAIALGGTVGALLRFKLSEILTTGTWLGVSLGTLSVNLIGSFIIGICYATIGTSALPTTTKLFIFTGLLGGFTTFSAYSLETVSLLQHGHVSTALMTIALHNTLGIGLAFLGYTLAKQFT